MSARAPTFKLPGVATLHIEAEGLHFSDTALAGLERLRESIGLLDAGIKNLTFYGRFLSDALRDGLVTRDDANALLARAPAEGLRPLGDALNTALRQRVMRLIAASPFALGPRQEKDLRLPSFGTGYSGCLVQEWGGWNDYDCRRLSRLSPPVRAWVWSQLCHMPVPCIDALELFDAQWSMDGVCNSFYRLARHPKVEESAVREEFLRLLEHNEIDETEDGQPVHYGVGTFENFLSMARWIVPIYRRRTLLVERGTAKRAPTAQSDAEERWLDFARRLARLPDWIKRQGLSFCFDSEEQKPIEFANILALHPDEFAVATTCFEIVDDGSGECPGVSYNMGNDDESAARYGLTSFALLPVLTASVFVQLSELCRSTKRA